MSAVRNMADGIHHKAGDDRAIGVRPDLVFADNLLGSQDDAVGGKGGFFLLTDDAPEVGVAAGVGALDMYDGDIRFEGGRSGWGDPVGGRR